MTMQRVKFPFESDYVNTISLENQPTYPGDEELERKIRSLLRWNAMAMVVKANLKNHGIGGHLSSYASSSNILEVAFNHFLRGHDLGGHDQVFFQGHSAPGIYARAFLEGRLSETHLNNFRAELAPGGGLSSYPHPYSMPHFWEFPTVSMGLGPLQAIYQARHNRYLKHRGFKDTDASRVWAFLGDGEMDEPESMGSLTMPVREGLNNLIFVINCNLQRLDGPVRGNGKIIQELESLFRGAGWNILKVIWGRDWDPLLAQDSSGILKERMSEAVDGEYQKYVVEPGAYTRQHFFGKSPELLKMVEHLSDDQIRKLGRGGHDSQKIYAAFHAAVNNQNPTPTVILAKTIKGYGLGDAAEGKNITHQQKKLNEKELKSFRDRFEIPIPDNQLKDIPFYRPEETSREIQYLKDRRHALGGAVPKRQMIKKTTAPFELKDMNEFMIGTPEGRDVSITMAFSAFLSKLLRHPELGKMIVPIVPDEARTFGMDPIFRQVGIYSSAGQLYEPVDSKMVLYYRESIDGQLLEEGITEAGAMSAFVAAGTSEMSHQVPLIPMFVFYSMFGFQRVGDLIWSLQDSRCRGFLFGATYGRTTLMGEGLQHQDGHSHLVASAYPRIVSYEPAFAYELITIIQEGIRRMYQEGEEVTYYITLQNENYPMRAAPENFTEVQEGILKGMYLVQPSQAQVKAEKKIALLGSGSLLIEALKAQTVLEKDHGISVDVWNVTSYTELRREALKIEAHNLDNPQHPKTPWLVKTLFKNGAYDKVVAVSDNVTLVPDQIARWVPNFHSLGTDGLGLSETREALRKHFRIDMASIVKTVLVN